MIKVLHGIFVNNVFQTEDMFNMEINNLGAWVSWGHKRNYLENKHKNGKCEKYSLAATIHDKKTRTQNDCNFEMCVLLFK